MSIAPHKRFELFIANRYSLNIQCSPHIHPALHFLPFKGLDFYFSPRIIASFWLIHPRADGLDILVVAAILGMFIALIKHESLISRFVIITVLRSSLTMTLTLRLIEWCRTRNNVKVWLLHIVFFQSRLSLIMILTSFLEIVVTIFAARLIFG